MGGSEAGVEERKGGVGGSEGGVGGGEGGVGGGEGGVGKEKEGWEEGKEGWEISHMTAALKSDWSGLPKPSIYIMCIRWTSGTNHHIQKVLLANIC